MVMLTTVSSAVTVIGSGCNVSDSVSAFELSSVVSDDVLSETLTPDSAED